MGVRLPGTVSLCLTSWCAHQIKLSSLQPVSERALFMAYIWVRLAIESGCHCLRAGTVSCHWSLLEISFPSWGWSLGWCKLQRQSADIIKTSPQPEPGFPHPFHCFDEHVFFFPTIRAMKLWIIFLSRVNHNGYFNARKMLEGKQIHWTIKKAL